MGIDINTLMHQEVLQRIKEPWWEKLTPEDKLQILCALENQDWGELLKLHEIVSPPKFKTRAREEINNITDEARRSLIKK